jgi:hypothetical protein
VAGARGQDGLMARFPIFFIAAFVMAIALIGSALLPLRPLSLGPVETRATGTSLVLDGAALSHISSAEGFPVTGAPGPRGDQAGPRLASFSVLAPGAKFSKGARLLLGPATQKALIGKDLRVTIMARAIPNTPAQNMAFGLVTSGPINWRQVAVNPTISQLTLDFAKTNQPIEALAFWPAVEGQGHGIEITAILLQPLDQTESAS